MNDMNLYVLRWIITLALAFLAGKLITKLKMPAILGWLIAGMLLGPNALGLLPQEVMNTLWYKRIITWMQCAFGLMLGTELIWKKMYSHLSGFCLRRNRSGHRPGSGRLYRAGISYPWPGDRYTAPHGSIG